MNFWAIHGRAYKGNIGIICKVIPDANTEETSLGTPEKASQIIPVRKPAAITKEILEIIYKETCTSIPVGISKNISDGISCKFFLSFALFYPNQNKSIDFPIIICNHMCTEFRQGKNSIDSKYSDSEVQISSWNSSEISTCFLS